MARKRTKAEAKERIEKVPTIPPGLSKLIPQLKVPTAVARGAKGLANLLVELDPLDRLATESQVISKPDVVNMNKKEAIKTVVNEPDIKLTKEMVDMINDDNIMINDNGDLVTPLMRSRSASFDVRDRLGVEQKKKKKKVSKYQKELGRQLRMLKKKHPRTAVTKLMKRAHRQTKNVLK